MIMFWVTQVYAFMLAHKPLYPAKAHTNRGQGETTERGGHSGLVGAGLTSEGTYLQDLT